MPASATIAGADVLDCRIDLPLSGRWTAEATLATATAPSGAATLACDGGLSLTGYVVRARVHLDACAVWLVGGAGGLSEHVSGAFRFAQLSDPLRAIAAATGETLDDDIDADLLALPLARWTLSGTGAASLDALCAEASRQRGARIRWRFTSAGRLWIGAEAWAAATLPDHAVVLDEEPGQNVRIVGAETPTIEPGQDVADVGRVVHVTHAIRADECRSRCHIETDALSGFRRGVRGVLGLRERADDSAPADTAELWRFGLYEARVDVCAANGSTVDVTPVDARLSPMQGVPVRQPLPKSVIVVAAGARVLLGWEGGDPTKPYVATWIEGDASKIVIPSTALYLGGESGALDVARKTDAVTGTATMVAWIAAVQAITSALAVLAGAPAPVAPTGFGTITGGSTVVKSK